MKKIVNGVEVECSLEEQQDIERQWTEGDEKIRLTKYIYDRKAIYPSITDQLDLLYHQGFDAWAEMIKNIKDKYPKPTQ